MADKEYLSRKEASTFLQSIGCPMTPQRLAKLAVNNNAGGGPPYDRYGWRTLVYSRKELAAWAAKRKVTIR